jgi:hypothetical protein
VIYIPWHFPLQFDDRIQGASTKAENEFQRLYPAVYSHMLRFKDVLSKRNQAETGIRYEWYAMQRWGSNYWEDFSKPKIQWKRVGSILRFAYDEEGMIPLDSSCFAIGRDVKYLCCILNSPMGHFLLKDAPKTGTGDLLISVQAVTPILIPYPKKFPTLYDRLTSMFPNLLKSGNEKLINQIVFELYNLSQEEVSYVEENFG